MPQGEPAVDEPGTVKRGPNGEVAIKTSLEDDAPGGVHSWIVVEQPIGLTRHAHTRDVADWT